MGLGVHIKVLLGLEEVKREVHLPTPVREGVSPGGGWGRCLGTSAVCRLWPEAVNGLEWQRKKMGFYPVGSRYVENSSLGGCKTPTQLEFQHALSRLWFSFQNTVWRFQWICKLGCLGVPPGNCWVWRSPPPPPSLGIIVPDEQGATGELLWQCASGLCTNTLR